ncbi:amidase [Virgibacillus sp. 179-BFC.A HS]|uniref:Amidase n=1 Tax=Tigheibacillus jepli TaxID=3035914 RepID=A0ABU5CJG1_9BACI|nr:amidase [Virgibacillus sp. 179-BFC.A HS]MDY0406370.1 amidase [Virgibacillus sp. 179-BFC.A HS]
MTEIVEAQHKTILDMDATELAQKIRDREITCTEAVSDYIKQITKVNPRINAMVEERFTQAIEEAKEKDLQLNESTAKGDLFGVPISVKEAYDVAGMKTTGGLLYRRKAFASEDAEVVKRLKNAGAIILGKTNTPELCFCQETENKLYGRTNNPWDIARTAGGSSGGEGSLLAAGGAAIGIGSDIGGSIRFPSHFNGVIGFKSGMFQVSADGNFPNINHPLQQRMLGLGPMGKSVRDMKRMYHIIADRKPAAKTLDSVQIDILPAATNFPLAKYSKELLDDVAHFLSSFFPIERAVPPYFNDSALLWQEIMSIDGERASLRLLCQIKIQPYGRNMPRKGLPTFHLFIVICHGH